MKPTLPSKLLTIELENPAVTVLERLSFFENPGLEEKEEPLPTDTSLPDEADDLSYTATATILGQEKTPLQGLIMSDIGHIAIGAFGSKQLSINDLFEGFNETAGNYLHFKKPRITIDGKITCLYFPVSLI